MTFIPITPPEPTPRPMYRNIVPIHCNIGTFTVGHEFYMTGISGDFGKTIYTFTDSPDAKGTTRTIKLHSYQMNWMIEVK